MYRGRPSTLYCGCPYDPRRMQADRKSCGYARSLRVNWEHVVPASELGRRRASYKGDHPRCRAQRVRGRSCARMIDPGFNRMEGDLYNLHPSLMDLNRARASIPPGEVPGEPRRFGDCDFEVERHRVEPPNETRGDVARTYFYMDEAYPEAKIINPQLKAILTKWAKGDPVDAAECERAESIKRVQGNENRFVAEACRSKTFR